MPLQPTSAPQQMYVPAIPPTTISLGETAGNPAAPLSEVQPSVNPVVNAALGLGPAAAVNIGTGVAAGPEVPLIAGALGVLLDYLKNRRWFPEQHTTLVLIVLSFIVCLGVGYFFLDDLRRGALDAFGTIITAHTNYRASLISGIGVLAPTREENRHDAPHVVTVPDLIIAER